MTDPIGPGARLDRYEVERALGAGGMGAVYLARHVHLGTPVVIKVLKPVLATDPEAIARFVREAKAAAAIGHPNIVRALDFGTTASGQPFLVMERVDGQDLEAILRATPRLPPALVCDLALQILAGLGAAHRAGIIHRDVKPANVLVTAPPGQPEQAKLLDFGVSKVIEGTSLEVLTRTGVLMGTPVYMAPEQFRGARDVDARADLWAVGVMMYRMLAGALPYDGETLEQLLLRLLTEPPRPLAQLAPHVPPPLVPVVERALARDPADRWPSAEAMADAILTASRGTTYYTAPAAPAAPMLGAKGETALVAGVSLGLIALFCVPTLLTVLMIVALVWWQMHQVAETERRARELEHEAIERQRLGPSSGTQP